MNGKGIVNVFTLIICEISIFMKKYSVLLILSLKFTFPKKLDRISYAVNYDVRRRLDLC